MINGGTHHHGLLAGASAGAVAVIAGAGMAMILPGPRHQVSEVLVVVVWSAAAAVIVATFAGTAYAVLWLRHKSAQLRAVPGPGPVVAAPVMSAEVVSEPPVALPPASPLAIAPPASTVPHVALHLPEGITEQAAVAVARALSTGGQAQA